MSPSLSVFLLIITRSFAANTWMFHPDNGIEYYFHSDCYADKSSAEAKCIALGGTALAIASTPSIRQFLLDFVYDGTESMTTCAGWRGFWTDGYLNYYYQWIFFSNDAIAAFVTVDWDSQFDEPGTDDRETCFGFKGETKKWHSIVCIENNAFFCERGPTPAPTPLTALPTAVPTPLPTAAPTCRAGFCGYTLFVKGYNIWSMETSGNDILDIDFNDANIEGYTTEGSTCSLSSLEFDSSFSTYESYAKSDSVSIEAGFNAKAAAAGGAYSTERTETKTFAATAQTYIYTVDLKCKKSQASLNNFNDVFWSSNFINHVRFLPSTFEASDIDEYEYFWDKFGTHVIQSADFGGTIRGAVTVDKCALESSFSTSDAYEVCLNAAYKGVEVAGCYGESESETTGDGVTSSVTNKRIVMKGGSTSTFSEAFNSFGDKSNDFQSWIDTLAESPDIVSGNLVEIHRALKEALILGNHKLNNASNAALADAEWAKILSALGDAYDYKSAQIEGVDSKFSDLNLECQVVCHGGVLDKDKCSCTECSAENNCCATTNTAVSHHEWRTYIICFFTLFAFL